MSSYLLGIKVTPSATPQVRASCRVALRVALLVTRDGEAASTATSSAYLNLDLRFPIWNRGVMYSMNRMPETGDPCGRPQERSMCGPSSLSKQTYIDLPVANEAIQLQRVVGHPCERSQRISLPGSIPSKAPLISQVRREAVRPLLSTCSIS